jgi:hypothetical protein
VLRFGIGAASGAAALLILGVPRAARFRSKERLQRQAG